MLKVYKVYKVESMGKNKNVKNDSLGKVECLIIFKCNCRCIMCSTGMQIDRSINSRDYCAVKPFEEVIKDIDRAKKMNARGVAFSGGEPNLRKDLILLIKYAKTIGLRHIEVQSNGRVYAYKKYCQRLVNGGVTHFVISLHSYIEEIHDKIMGAPGTFKQTTEGIRNLNSLGVKVNINIVLTKLNYSTLEEHVKFLMKNFDINEIRFTFVMLEGNTCDNPRAIVPHMSDVGPHICKGIDIAKDKASCFIYNMVPCLVPGCEKYINDMGQLDTLLIGPDFEASLDEERKGKKIKSKECEKCKYDKICYGIWKKYADLYGISELKSVK
ncbi:hypothetical protein A2331_01680 [Candidatus Falkowbacteria bacterium RIFOXYB2_FULL_34_18]|uniref:Radical SAM core domain-containing protein n=1 Tax=Candidatus Falkowbacteria bacterium RIFOXYD2_FULL_34_120 TaxID=1798007 RepID=A0A1F5TPW7_9BACT|nr:MAG: hypothetical protein A2331_01680 [Candidatus Falkowbacteria bacterium RIFOXYB2_FULL_34_18]OGF29322.1 MAG: hypothetical protein A2500_05560 [Candidatus Falkowbacteria bacterium RIFOXYC12_FULL_34_55]OGF36438.1 MAG: hypothetical protein A2466_01220 [Candidatus Falkowbacteria bacterium RIFOXYC2_FULL_34_220]OGF38917.1 MAG: hypothetical protein A2515_05980 [Candidatus Falkowbacteria bacterium RIFOXYD12_FULL_34_57]OGF40936.1 MAG: hypothetical protein A2531_04205 [Candidatus Falkowbacteria bact